MTFGKTAVAEAVQLASIVHNVEQNLLRYRFITACN